MNANENVRLLCTSCISIFVTGFVAITVMEMRISPATVSFGFRFWSGSVIACVCVLATCISCTYKCRHYERIERLKQKVEVRKEGIELYLSPSQKLLIAFPDLNEYVEIVNNRR